MAEIVRCQDYLMSAASGIEGWLGPGAATTTMLVSQWQGARGIRGAVGEIGVHHGRFFVFLGCLARPGERGVAVDIFEAQELNVDHSGAGNRAIFEENLARYGLENVTVITGDSLALSADTLLDSLKGQRARLFSVDGGHTPLHLVNDVGIARGTLAPGGLVIIDDFFHPHWPGVTEGIFEYHRLYPGGRIVCIGDGKAWVSFDESGEDLYQFLKTRRFLAHSAKEVELWGKPCLALSMLPPSETFRCPRLLPLGVWQGMGLKELVSDKSHWAGVGDGGSWSISERSEIEPSVRKEGSGDVKVRLRLMSYTDTRMNYRRITIEAAGITKELDLADRVPLTADLVLPACAFEPALRISFKVEDRITPASAGINQDDRPLGVFLSEVRIDQLI